MDVVARNKVDVELSTWLKADEALEYRWAQSVHTSHYESSKLESRTI